MPDLDDPLASFRHPDRPAPVKPAVVSPSGIKLREYKAFTLESSRSSLLLLKSSLVKKAAAGLAVPYSYLTSSPMATGSASRSPSRFPSPRARWWWRYGAKG